MMLLMMPSDMAANGPFNSYNVHQGVGEAARAPARRSNTIPSSSVGLQLQGQLLHGAPFVGGRDDSAATQPQPHPGKRRRTNSYLAPAEAGEAAYAAFAPLPQDARPTFAPYSQPVVDQTYFHMNGGDMHHGTPHQPPPPPPLYHSESSLDSMSSAYPGYIHDPAMMPHNSDHTHAPEPWDPMLFDTGLQLKVQSLPVLDSCATKILEALSSPDWHDVLEAVTQPESGRGQAYSTQVALFDQIKTYYTRDHLFLNAQTLNLDHSADDIIRKTNLATFAATIFGQQNVPFSELHAHCLDIFLPNGAGLTKPISGLLLELKTQAYLAAIHTGTPNQQDLLEYFPSDVQAQLNQRRVGTPPLSPVEVAFVSKVNMRRQQLLDEQYAPYSAPMYQTWPWQNLLQILCECLRQTLHPGMNPTSPVNTDFDQMLFPNGVHPAQLPSAQPPPSQADPMQYPSYREQDGGPTSSLSRVRSMSQTSAGASHAKRPSISSKSEKAPMQQQYEKARASAATTTPPNSSSTTTTATTKATPPARRVSVASQRKPWSQEEEKALMDGLGQVKGPHWSQILALYGVGGRVSEVLRERTQVQLKDKARNLKLFFLKSGMDVPAPLQGVTGELKTRAPAQAAKREREERAKAEKEAQERALQEQQAVAPPAPLPPLSSSTKPPS